MLTVKEKMSRVDIHNGFVKIPYDKTMMTVPKILLTALRGTFSNPKETLKGMASETKRNLIRLGLSDNKIKGKLSTKVQELAWGSILSFNYKVKLNELEGSVLIPYSANGFKSTMTVPFFVVSMVMSYAGLKTKLEAKRYISNIASDVRTEFMRLEHNMENKNVFSIKVQERVILTMLSDFAKKQV